MCKIYETDGSATGFLRRERTTTMDTKASAAGREATTQHDAGLRAHMLNVYNYLAGGIGLAAIIAYFVFSLGTTVDPSLVAVKLSNGIMLTAFGKALFTTKWVFALVIAPLAFIIVLALTAHWLGVAGLQVAYWLFVSLMGASLSVIFVVFKLGSITQVFAATSLSFAALSLYGYTTKRALSGWGTFLYMGLAGIIIAGCTIAATRYAGG